MNGPGSRAHPVAVPSVAAEYAWLRSRVPGARVSAQALLSVDGRLLDRLTVHAPDGRSAYAYFDVTAEFRRDVLHMLRARENHR